MNTLIKNAGIIVIMIGVIFLAYNLLANKNSNILLFISLLLVLIGLAGHVLIDKHFLAK